MSRRSVYGCYSTSHLGSVCTIGQSYLSHCGPSLIFYLHGASKLSLSSSISLDLPIAPNSVAYRNPIYHQTVFASIILAVAARTTYVLQWSDKATTIPTKTKDSIATSFNKGLGLFLLGFFVWNIDNIFCQTLTKWKILVGWPAAFFLEGKSTLAPLHSTDNEFYYRTLLVACFDSKYLTHSKIERRNIFVQGLGTYYMFIGIKYV